MALSASKAYILAMLCFNNISQISAVTVSSFRHLKSTEVSQVPLSLWMSLKLLCTVAFL